ncbi:MAG: DUF58 domain-containing protein [Phycisphaerales bacterium]
MARSDAITAERYLDPESLARLGSFDLRAKMIVEGIRSGMHESPYHGVSVEFAQHRPYVQGDDLRHLDWKVFGRSDKLHLKQFEQETNLDVVLLVDSSGSMSFGSLKVEVEGGERTWTKFDHATSTAAAISYLAVQQQDRVGMVVFADGIRTIVARSSARGHWRQLVSALNTHTVEHPTNLARCVDQTLGKVSNRVLMVIVSDFFDDLGLVRTAFARARHRGHDIIALQTLDRQEMRFDFRNAAPFEGLESEGRVNLDPRSIRKEYLAALREHCRGLESVARSFGFDYQRLDTHEPIGPTLSHFLARRVSSMRKGRRR